MSTPVVPSSAPCSTEAHLPPALAIIANCQAPYRLHLHLRIARELPELHLHSIFTWGPTPSAPWQLPSPPEINAVSFREDNDAQITSFLGCLRRDWEKGGRIIRYLQAHGVKAVIVNGYNDAGRVRIIRWCQRQGIPCLLWADSNIRGDRTTPLKRVLKKLFVASILRSCTGLLPCGQLGQAYFERYGGQRDRMFLLPLEADYDLINGLSQDALNQVCTQYALQPGRRRIVYSGRLVGLKRVDLLIDAFAAIAAQRPEWDLVLVGDGVLRQQLAARVPAQLQGRVFWTGFLEDQAAISAIYRASDVLALCSEYEAWALVVIEAAAAGLALVCSDQVGAAPELLQDRRNGRLFPSGNLQALIESLLDVTAPDHIDAMKAATGAVLDDWRRRADPIQGLRQALRFCGVLPEHSPSTR